MTTEEPTFVISVAAELAGMHPQTLRQYDRLGLVTPSRARGKGRRYSRDDVETLREIQRLSRDEGINLAGIRHIIELRSKLKKMERDMQRTARQLIQLQEEADARRSHRVFTAGPAGDVVVVPHGIRLKGRLPEPHPPMRARPILALAPARPALPSKDEAS